MTIICNFSCGFQKCKHFYSKISILGDNYGMFGYFEPHNFGAKRSRLPTILNLQYLCDYREFLVETYIFIFLIKLSILCILIVEIC